MKKEEKLKIAIDFIADYLSPALPVEKVTEDVENTDEDVLVETESEDHLKRAYTLMKKLEARDVENAKINHEVKRAVNPIKEELKRVKAEHEDKILEDKLIERKKEGSEVGVTIDEKTGNMVKVSVETLPSSNARPAFINANVVEKAVKTMLNDDKNSELDMEDEPLTHNID